jgi:putative transposase
MVVTWSVNDFVIITQVRGLAVESGEYFHRLLYLKGYATMGELMVGLAEYFVFYNGERPHQSPGNALPAEAKSTTASKTESKATPGQRRPVASEVNCTT